MSSTPSKEQLKFAFERVLPDDEDMSTEEKVAYLVENQQALARALRQAGFGKARPSDILDGFYSGGQTQTTTVNPEIVKAVNKEFANQPEVEPHDPSESPTLAHFYGGDVVTQAGSTRGDHFPTKNE